MSPASYLTAPPRGVGPIVATLVTIVPMWDWAIWGALIVVALAGTAALVLFALRTRQAWRDARDTPRDVLSRLDEFSRQAEAVAEKVAAASDTTGELEASVERLRVSLAQLAVLRAALDEATGTVGRVAAYLPTK
jgi:hypothetical protein